MNILSAPFGGYMMCHGAGGVAGHHHFGGRSATATLIIGLAFLILGLSLGDGAYALLRTIPNGVLGALLLLTGIELASSSKPQRFEAEDLFVVITMAAFTLVLNPAVAFAVGLALLAARKWGPKAPQ